MSRLAKILALGTVVVAVAAVIAACGTERVSVPKEQAQLYRGAQLFNQRCSGCHNLHLPEEKAPAEWPKTVAEMERDAHVTPQERPLIEAYLVTMSSRAGRVSAQR